MAEFGFVLFFGALIFGVVLPAAIAIWFEVFKHIRKTWRD